jgi:hypothetical protein
MRLAGIFMAAIAASIVAGALALAAVSLLPDWDDAAGRGLGQAFLALLTATYVVVSAILLGFAMWRRARDRHLRRPLYILLLAPFLIVVLGAIDNGIRQIDWIREIVGMIQMFIPLWTVALVQWLIVHSHSARGLRAEAASA